MLHGLPNHPPPIVGSYPFTGVRVVVVSAPPEEDVEQEESESEDVVVQQAIPGRLLGDELPPGLPALPEKGNPFTGLGVISLFPETSPAPIASVAAEKPIDSPYDQRGLPNVPPPVQNNRGIHTKIPVLAQQKTETIESKPAQETTKEEPAPPQAPVVDLHKLTSLFFAYFPKNIPSWRHVGSISEYPLVRKDGRAADMAELWPSLRPLGFQEHREPNGMLSGLVGPDYAIRCGVGRGIVAIHIPPQNDLHSLCEVRTRALEQLSAIAHTRKLQLLGYGIHPIAVPEPEQLNHIFHVFSLFKSIGEEWKLYGVCAQEYVQLTCGTEEFLEQLKLGHMLEPVMLALFGNSVVWGGEDHYRCAGAQHLQDQFPLESGRCGMFASFPKTVEEYVQNIVDRKNLLLTDAEGWKNSCTEVFSSLLVEHDMETLLLEHMSCDWGPVRPVLESGLLEWRCAQQPQDAQISFAALTLGIMERLEDWKLFLDSFSNEPLEPMMVGIRMEELHKIRMERVRDPWDEFLSWRKTAIDYGLGKGELFTGLIESVLQLAQDGLEARGMGEEVYLAPLWKRWETKQNPAQYVRRAFARGGIDSLLDVCRIGQSSS